MFFMMVLERISLVGVQILYREVISYVSVYSLSGFKAIVDVHDERVAHRCDIYFQRKTANALLHLTTNGQAHEMKQKPQWEENHSFSV